MITPILLIVVSVGVFLWAIASLYSHQQVQQARSRGLWPKPGQIPTMEDVKRLAQAGEKILAIKLYRQIHHVGLAEAKDAVEKLAT